MKYGPSNWHAVKNSEIILDKGVPGGSTAEKDRNCSGSGKSPAWVMGSVGVPTHEWR